MISIDGTDPFAASKPDARLIKLLLKARRFNATLVGSDDVPVAALAEREGVSPSYFTRLVRLSYLAPDTDGSVPSITILISRPARRSRTGTDRISVSSSITPCIGDAATSRSVLS